MINLDLTWDVSATLSTSTYGNLYKRKITGRFNPSVATYENIYNLVAALSELAAPMFVETILTATSKTLTSYFPEE